MKTYHAASVKSWAMLLSGFNEIAFFDVAANHATCTSFNVHKAVALECESWPFLIHMIPRDLNNRWKEMTPSQLYNRLEGIFHTYYQHVWSLCTKSERWALYDLATDGFANPSNKRVLRHLIKKKLVVHERWFRPAAESFRLFILQEFKTGDRPTNVWNRMNWGLLRIPLIAVLLGGSAFLFLTQQELMQLYASVASTIILGVVPLILSSLGLSGKA